MSRFRRSDQSCWRFYQLCRRTSDEYSATPTNGRLNQARFSVASAECNIWAEMISRISCKSRMVRSCTFQLGLRRPDFPAVIVARKGRCPERDYPDVTVLDTIFTRLRAEPREKAALQQQLRIDEE